MKKTVTKVAVFFCSCTEGSDFPLLTTRLVEKAEKADCDYALDVFYRYGTDGSTVIRAGNNEPALGYVLDM